MRLSNICLALSSLYSGFGAGTSLALNFTSGNNTLDPRITFGRTTNATLTNSAGLVSYAPHNLLTYSEQFDNAAWTKVNATVTANAVVAPNGSTTAEFFIPSSGTIAPKAVAAGVSGSLGVGSTYTLSVYAKANGYDFISLSLHNGAISAGNEAIQNFNLATGTVASSFNTAPTNASITSVGNGWYRCVITWVISTTTPNVAFFVVNTDANPRTTWVANGTSGIYIWGAQLEIGSTATTYNPTTVKNLLGFTEHFDNAAWTKSNATITSGFTDIYGQPFAQKLVESAAAGAHYIFGNVVTFAASTPYVFSFYAKAGERTVAQVVPPGTFGSTLFANFDLANGVVGSVGGGQQATITPVGNGWYRCAVYNTASVATQAYTIGTVTSVSSVRLESYTGDGTSGIYIFGAQLSDSASVDPYVYNPVAAPTAQAYYGPRFDYDPVTLQPKGLLIEEQRTNLVLNSSILNTQIVTVTAAAHTLSFYGTGTIVLSGAYTGTLVGTGAYPARTTLTFTPTVGVLTLTVTGSVTMAQLEAGAFATGYIPTVASQETRAADSASMIGNNFARWFNQNEGTVFVQADATVTSAVNAGAFALGSTTSDIMRIFRQTDAQPVAQVITGGAAQATMGMGATWTTTAAQKIAFAYATNNFSATTNGGTTITDTLGSVPVVSQAVLGNAAGIGALNGHLARIAFYSRVLSGAEQKGITS